jgi:alkylhydroperoxidase/carboxymuconolactone decarboxylase family protein YurZ
MATAISPSTAAARAEARPVAPKLIDRTREEIGEMITHLAFYTGWPAAMSASRIAKQLYDEKKESK